MDPYSYGFIMGFIGGAGVFAISLGAAIFIGKCAAAADLEDEAK